MSPSIYQINPNKYSCLKKHSCVCFRKYSVTLPGRVAQSVGHLTRVSQGSWVRYPVWQHTFVSPSTFSRRAVVSYWRKYVHEVLVNRLGGLSLPRKSVVRLTDRPDMTLDVYRGRDTRSGNILSFLLPLFQEGQLSVTGESMCTKYWLTA